MKKAGMWGLQPLTVKVKHDTKPLKVIHEDISSQPSYVDIEIVFSVMYVSSLKFRSVDVSVNNEMMDYVNK